MLVGGLDAYMTYLYIYIICVHLFFFTDAYVIIYI